MLSRAHIARRHSAGLVEYLTSFASSYAFFIGYRPRSGNHASREASSPHQDRLTIQHKLYAHSLTKLGTVPDTHHLYTGFQTWLPGWKAKNWRNAKGEPVKNRELIEYLSALLDRRALEGQKVRPSPSLFSHPY